MYSKELSSCGCPLGGVGLNVSEATAGYLLVPNTQIHVVSITLCGNVFNIDMFFQTVWQLFDYLNTTFVTVHGLLGYFFTNRLRELKYSNPEGFCKETTEWELLDLNKIAFTTELSSTNDSLPDFEPLELEIGGFYFIPENA